MIVKPGSRWQLRLQSGLAVLLFILLLAILAWLSTLNPLQIDISANQRNSLSEESVRLVKSLDSPLKITLFSSPLNENRVLLERLFERYVYQQPLIQFHSVNPDISPALLRQHDIEYDGETLIEYQGRSEKITSVTESAVTNSIQRLLRQGERWIVFLQGHGERNPYSESNHDYSSFAARLASKGFTIESINLTQTSSIPQNTDVLVLPSPRTALLPGEIDLIQEYLEGGGNLLWLTDPEQAETGLDIMAEILTIDFLPGTIVDPNSQLLGLKRVDFALVSEYPRHPITQNLDSLSLFPQALAIEFHGDSEIWEALHILRSGDTSWNETGAMQGEIFNGDDADELNGPLTIGITLAASLQDESGALIEQRIAVIGDADFISNRYLGNGANLELGLNLFNWLSHDDTLISINPRPAPDTRLDLSQQEQIIIGFGFLLLLPATLIGIGLRIWLLRRKL